MIYEPVGAPHEEVLWEDDQRPDQAQKDRGPQDCL